MPGATGSTSGALVVELKDGEIRGLKEFRKALRAMGPEWPKALRAANKRIADKGARLSQGYARGMGGVQAHFAGAIRGSATQRQARVGVSGRGGANVAFWGAKKRTGWYARSRYSGGPRQHPEWVGNTWDVAVAGQGPYAINLALATHRESLLDEYLDEIEALAHEAFPG
jgi:hypothetical protein